MPSADTTLVTDLDRCNALLQRLIGQRQAIESALAKAERSETKARADTAELEQVLELLQAMEQEWRDRFQQGLAGVVSEGLTSVFGEPIAVRLQTTTFRDTTSINLLVEQGGMATSIMDAKGGSLVQILAFLLRVLMLVSVQPPLQRVLILDEPFGMVSADLFPALCELIRGLRDRLGIQFIIVSHNDELLAAADAAYAVSNRDGVASVRPLTSRSEEAVL